MQSPTKPLVSVIIPHLNQPGDLESCLRSLEAQSLQRSMFEIIVVDNGSVSPPDAVVAPHPAVRLLCEPRPGPGLARNRGVDAAVGAILCFIDADCRADRDWLCHVVETFLSVPAGTILGGDVRIWRDDVTRFTALEAYETVFAYRFKLYIEQHGFCGTGNLAVRRADFERIGPFGGVELAEDIDWGRRACAAGFVFRYVPGMIVFHPARRSIGELLVKWDRHIQHALNMVQEKPWWRMYWLTRALGVLLSPILDVGKVLTSERIDGMATRFEASIVLIVVRAYRAWRMLALLWARKGILWNRESAVGMDEA